MIIPGQFISLITFPGVIVHELAHKIFCRIARVAVLEVCYFRFGNPAGYVIHEKPNSFRQHILISVGPFLVNTVIGALISLPGAIPVLKFESGSTLDIFLIWLGVSISMHSFPSTGDAKCIWNAMKQDNVSLLWKFIAFPIVGIIFLGAVGSAFWLDAIYGMGVAMFLPELIINIFI